MDSTQDRLKFTFDRMTKGRHLFKCHACGTQEVTYVDVASITHYCGGATTFTAVAEVSRRALDKRC